MKYSSPNQSAGLVKVSENDIKALTLGQQLLSSAVSIIPSITFLKAGFTPKQRPPSLEEVHSFSSALLTTLCVHVPDTQSHEFNFHGQDVLNLAATRPLKRALTCSGREVDTCLVQRKWFALISLLAQVTEQLSANYFPLLVASIEFELGAWR